MMMSNLVDMTNKISCQSKINTWKIEMSP